MLKEHAAPQSLADAIRYFADADVAFAFVVQLRWPNGVSCPRCHAEKPMYVKSRRIWKCRGCAKQFSVKVGTIFEDSPLGLDKWLPALWMLANCRNGISSYELGRDLGVTQKTAWFMLGRIRLAMKAKSFQRMKGEIEIDETFIGGLAHNMHSKKRKRVIRGRGAQDKTPVVAMVERNDDGASRVTANVTRWVAALPVGKQVRKNIEPGSAVYTDDALFYGKALGADYIHESVNHKAKEYVRGTVHTNSVENFWSVLKRAIKGTYVSVDPFHLFRYVDEQAFRFNVRGQSEIDRFRAVARDIIGKRLTYAKLTGANLKPATTPA